MSIAVERANRVAAAWYKVWQPLLVNHPTPWHLDDVNGEILVRDANGKLVLQYNDASHPSLSPEDWQHNATILVNTINNF
jgi:hypothetical protein